MKLAFTCCLAGLLCHGMLGAAIPLTLERFDGPDGSFVHAPESVVEIHGETSVRATPASPAGAGNWVLEMDYFSLGGLKAITVTPGPPFDTAQTRKLPEASHSETWTRYAAPLSRPGNPLPAGWKQLRLDLPLAKDAVLQIRNARLRPERPGEFDAKSPTAGNHTSTTASLEAYLNATFGSAITEVGVGTREITVSGTAAGGSPDLFLADVPMEYRSGDAPFYEKPRAIAPDSAGNFRMTVPRVAIRDGRDYDRLTSRWQVFRRSGGRFVPASHARYADDVACRAPDLPAAELRSKKGLGGWNAQRLPGGTDELGELGIAAVTVNLFSLHQFVALSPEPDTTPFNWQGRTYYAREKSFARYDRTFREAAEHKVMVSAILLIDNPVGSKSPEVRRLGFPGAVKEGKYAMPDVTSAEGIAYYGAILNLLVERWSHDGGPHGRVHHWIVHNEVDFGWIWTNAGKIEDLPYMDLYQRSMRLIHLIARQHDPHAQAFITLTHHWAQPGNHYGYGSKRMLELLLRFCRVEGDFDWALAYHPYPQSLFNPRTWEDTQATFDFNSPKITPWNLEVLDAYMKLPALRFKGRVRPVHLSENGFNSKDYSPKALEDQAAGMALAWKKMAGLTSILNWQYHNWIDNRREGGLRIGLRKFPDEPGDAYGKKPIWHLYQALGTPREDEVAAPYLNTIGISLWEEIHHEGAIQ